MNLNRYKYRGAFIDVCEQFHTSYHFLICIYYDAFRDASSTNPIRLELLAWLLAALASRQCFRCRILRLCGIHYSSISISYNICLGNWLILLTVSKITRAILENPGDKTRIHLIYANVTYGDILLKVSTSSSLLMHVRPWNH